MQIVEASAFGVRSAIHTLRRANTPLTFVLFPMIHAGSRPYFSEIERRLHECDVIFAEGVRSQRGNYLTWSYKIVNRMRRLGLVKRHPRLGRGLRGVRRLNTLKAGQSPSSAGSAFPRGASFGSEARGDSLRCKAHASGAGPSSRQARLPGLDRRVGYGVQLLTT